MIRLIATDLDGTLLDKNGRIPDGTFDVIEGLMDCGIHFAACSGRQYDNLFRLFAPVADRMGFICENGAFCVMDGQEAGTVPIPPIQVGQIVADLEQLGTNLLLSGKHTCYMLDRNRKYTDDIVYRLKNNVTIVESFRMIREPILKISGQRDEGVQAIAPILLDKWANTLTATISGRDWFDFTVANKGTGIQMLMAHLKISKEETLAFGDSFNDESMLVSVGNPFLMEKADPALRRPGFRVCDNVLTVLKAVLQHPTAEADTLLKPWHL